MYRNPTFDNVSWILSTIGALNWGFKGLLGMDLVKEIFGEDAFATRLIYALVGVAGAWSVYHLIMRQTAPPERAPSAFARLFGDRW